MKLLMGLVFALATFNVFAATPVGEYTIDTAHTKIGFEVPHMVISTVEGRFTKFDGTMTLDKKFFQSKVVVNVQMDSVDTTDAKRDEHLKSPDFFNAGKFPKMTFTSTEFYGTPEKLTIKGKLTIKDVTKEVVFNAKLSNEVADPFGNTRIAISGTTKVSRKEFGMTWGKMMEAGPIVGDDVTIAIKAEFTKKLAK